MNLTEIRSNCQQQRRVQLWMEPTPRCDGSRRRRTLGHASQRSRDEDERFIHVCAWRHARLVKRDRALIDRETTEASRPLLSHRDVSERLGG